MGVVDRSRRALALTAALATGWSVLSCGTSSGLQDQLHDHGGAADAGSARDAQAPAEHGQAGHGEAGSDAAPPACVPALAADALHPRSDAMASGAKVSAAGVPVSNLFQLFASNCGACHVDNTLGGFHVSAQSFTTVVSQAAYDRMTSDDPGFFMPPQGSNAKPFSTRDANDPIRELAGQLRAWLDAGRPEDVFYPKTMQASGGDPGRYLLSKTVGMQMTNLGNCIPAAKMVRDAQQRKDDELDAMFANATQLPDRLEQTDLVTLDAEALAKQGVVAFAPAYTLWADNAKKIRMVRVPRGQAIEFDPATQSFSIPANTRFYKTFLKHVIDVRGNEAYRKMETRVIVSRPDTELPDGTQQHAALFGTYVWNEAETEAVLLREPLRNGQPFRDHLETYVTDEHAAEDVITTGPDNLQEALQNAGLVRTYAVPGSERCIQCHMGSPSKSFVLGFSPLQLERRKIGTGGVIERAERDELNQLQRLIDYGLIKGMTSPKDVVLLEDSEGHRKPRNDHELEAQGYMLGNCAHCHNPRGYPSTIAPELRDTLNFMPSEVGGIFQFPLEKFSPRIFRGTFQNVPQPYITPSLYDRPAGLNLPDVDVGPADGENYAIKETSYTDPQASRDPLLAPWRSLIYRNVDTPFTYEEDFSIYPHMPMNTSGYDCRARQLLGSWMASIPARLKAWPGPQLPGVGEVELEKKHPEAQPFVEVTPDDSDYERQRRIGETRVAHFRDSLRYSDCPDPIKVDIVDPAVVHGDALVPKALTQVLLDDAGNVLGGYSLRVPEREHYAITDLTNPPGDWFPRRPDWSQLLVDLDIDAIDNPVLKQRIQTLHGVEISDQMRALALADIPFGLWKSKDGCDLASQPKVSDFTTDTRPRWMNVTAATPDERVYSISPGAEIFTQICSNCHGPEADSKGRLAATIADMTGGQTRVANLRDGFFGPTDKPGTNRDRIFGPFSGAEGSAEVWAARYLMFMGLGGTQRTIPKPALQTIRNGAVLGEKRPNPNTLDVSTANMLSVPLALCRAVIPGGVSDFLIEIGDLDYSASAEWKSPLIERNGDVELWQTLCAQDNEPPPVRVVQLAKKTDGVLRLEVSPSELRRASAYPVDARAGDRRGDVQPGIQPANAAPWCVQRPTDADVLALLTTQWEAHTGAGNEPPFCPDAFLSDGTANQNLFTEDDVERWSTRGAMNAGLSVFLYLDALSKGLKKHPIPYDRCEDLRR
jgi:mono/diheme cytochrome c family protein